MLWAWAWGDRDGAGDQGCTHDYTCHSHETIGGGRGEDDRGRGRAAAAAQAAMSIGSLLSSTWENSVGSGADPGLPAESGSASAFPTEDVPEFPTEDVLRTHSVVVSPTGDASDSVARVIAAEAQKSDPVPVEPSGRGASGLSLQVDEDASLDGADTVRTAKQPWGHSLDARSAEADAGGRQHEGDTRGDVSGGGAEGEVKEDDDALLMYERTRQEGYMTENPFCLESARDRSADDTLHLERYFTSARLRPAAEDDDLNLLDRNSPSQAAAATTVARVDAKGRRQRGKGYTRFGDGEAVAAKKTDTEDTCEPRHEETSHRRIWSNSFAHFATAMRGSPAPSNASSSTGGAVGGGRGGSIRRERESESSKSSKEAAVGTQGKRISRVRSSSSASGIISRMRFGGLRNGRHSSEPGTSAPGASVKSTTRSRGDRFAAASATTDVGAPAEAIPSADSPSGTSSKILRLRHLAAAASQAGADDDIQSSRAPSSLPCDDAPDSDAEPGPRSLGKRYVDGHVWEEELDSYPTEEDFIARSYDTFGGVSFGGETTSTARLTPQESSSRADRWGEAPHVVAGLGSRCEKGGSDGEGEGGVEQGCCKLLDSPFFCKENGTETMGWILRNDEMRSAFKEVRTLCVFCRFLSRFVRLCHVCVRVCSSLSFSTLVEYCFRLNFA